MPGEQQPGCGEAGRLAAERRASFSLCLPVGILQPPVPQSLTGVCAEPQPRSSPPCRAAGLSHRAVLGFRCTLHIALGSRLFCLGLKQKWHKVSFISVISLMRWEKRKLASSKEEMLMLFHNFYNDI